MNEVTKNWDEEITQHSTRETELGREQSGLWDTLTRLKELLAELQELQIKLQKETSSPSDGPSLVTKAEELMIVFDGEANKYIDSPLIESMRKTLSPLDNIITYLQYEDRLNA